MRSCKEVRICETQCCCSCNSVSYTPPFNHWLTVSAEHCPRADGGRGCAAAYSPVTRATSPTPLACLLELVA
jgi:hypothetical protein